MKTSDSALVLARYPRKVIIGLIAGWVVIVAKCAVAPSLMSRWEVPVAPAWVIVPTLIFAALITLLVLTHDWVHDDED